MYILNKTSEMVIGQYNKDGIVYVRVFGENVVDYKLSEIFLPKEVLDLVNEKAYHSPLSKCGKNTYIILKFNSFDSNILLVNAVGDVKIVSSNVLATMLLTPSINKKVVVKLPKSLGEFSHVMT